MFKLLYLLNHISCFNNICKMCCVIIVINSLKVSPKSVQPLLKYRFFSSGLFLLAHPVRMSITKIRKET